MLAYDSVLFIRILTAVVNRVNHIEIEPTFYSSFLSLHQELLQARRLGCYKALIAQIISDLQNGVSIENLEVGRSVDSGAFSNSLF